MRVTSALWVGAYVRRCHQAGAIATVARRGAEEAGAILVIVDWLDRTADLYTPAPQSFFGEDHPSERLFQRVLTRATAAEIAEHVAGETRFDPDLWLVEVEDKAGRCFLDLVEDKREPR